MLEHRCAHRPQPLAESLLVEHVSVDELPTVRAKRLHQKTRLPQQPFGATVEIAAGLQLSDEQSFERIDAAAVAMEVFVQAEDLEHESRPQLERWRAPNGEGVLCCLPEYDFSLQFVQPRGRRPQPRMHLPVPLLARRDLGHRQHRRRVGSSVEYEALEC